MLIEDEGETMLRPGDAAGFKAGVAERPSSDQSHRTRRACYLEIGTRAPRERAHYPDVDLESPSATQRHDSQYTHRSQASPIRLRGGTP